MSPRTTTEASTTARPSRSPLEESDDWVIRKEDKNITGTSDIGSFLSASENTVFVFPENIGNNRLQLLQIAATASHEAGHAFSLHHHSIWSKNGKKITNQYDPGTDDWTPIMGQNTSADRTTWSRGVTDEGPNSFQDDFAILGGLLGFRPDEPSVTTLAAANNTAAINSPLTGSGMINTTNDVDVFQFTTAGGQVSINVKAATIGPDLLPRAELWNASGRMATGTFNSPTASVADPKNSVINATLPSGTYFIHVQGGGDYCDLGQYTVSVTTKQIAVQGTSGTTKKTPTSSKNLTTTKFATVNSTNTSNSLGSKGATDGAPVINEDVSTIHRPANKVITLASIHQSGLSPDAFDAFIGKLDRIIR